MNDDVVIKAEGLTKIYKIYERDIDRLVNEVANIGKSNYVINFRVHCLPAVSHQKTIHVNIFYACHVRTKTCTKFKK